MSIDQGEGLLRLLEEACRDAECYAKRYERDRLPGAAEHYRRLYTIRLDVLRFAQLRDATERSKTAELLGSSLIKPGIARATSTGPDTSRGRRSPTGPPGAAESAT